MNFFQLFTQGDAVSSVVAVLLLGMSVASWVVILWKTRLLHRAGLDVSRSVAAFWQAPTVDAALQRLPAFDRLRMVLPLIEATAPETGGATCSVLDLSKTGITTAAPVLQPPHALALAVCADALALTADLRVLSPFSAASLLGELSQRLATS